MSENFEKFVSRTVNGSANMSKFILIIAFVKFLKCLSIYESYDLLGYNSVFHFLYFVKLFSTVIFILMKRSLIKSMFVMSKKSLAKVVQLSILCITIEFMYLFGLTICGPIHSILVYEHSAQILVAIFSGILSKSNYTRTRGSILFFLGVVTLFLFDSGLDNLNDSVDNQKEKNWFYFFGITKRKSGILLLLLVLFFKIIHYKFSKKLAAQLGGPIKLNMYSSLMITFLLTPVYILSLLFGSESYAYNGNILKFALIAILMYILDFYTSNFMQNKYEGLYTHKIGYISVAISALITGYYKSIYNTNAISKIDLSDRTVKVDNLVSGSVLVGAIFFILSSDILSWSGKKSKKGNFIGFSSEGTPLFSFVENTFNNSSSSSMQSLIKQIFERKGSKISLLFLSINISFAFFELFYGFYNNSLVLFLDSFNKLFNSITLVIELIDSVVSKWKPNRSFPYGYGRVKVLLSYINLLFLFATSTYLSYEGFMRLSSPPTVGIDRLYTVSVTGFVIKLIGIYIHQHSFKKRVSLKEVYLGFIIDLLGSTAVIVSAFCIIQYELYVADLVSTFLITIVISYSLLPKLLKYANILTMSLSSKDQKRFELALIKVSNIEGVNSMHSCRVWEHGNDDFRAALSLIVHSHVTEQRIITQATGILRESGVNTSTIQIEKDDFYQHLSGLKLGSEEVLAPRTSIKNKQIQEYTKLI